jgi:hypothetical protein
MTWVSRVLSRGGGKSVVLRYELRRFVAVVHTVVAHHAGDTALIVGEDVLPSSLLRRLVCGVGTPGADGLLIPPVGN